MDIEYIRAARADVLRKSSKRWRDRIRLHLMFFPHRCLNIRIGEDRILIDTSKIDKT